MIKYMLNPFAKIANHNFLRIGAAVLIIDSLFNSLFSVSRPQFFSFITESEINFSVALSQIIIRVFILSVIFHIIALIFSKNHKSFSNSFALQSIACLPILLTPLIVVLESFQLVHNYVILTLVSIIFIWHLILIFNAFKHSSGLQNFKVVLSFVIGLFISVLLSNYIIFLSSCFVKM